MLIQKPILTEKSQFLNKKNKVYSFYVLPSANKFQIKQAVEKMFKDANIKVKNVRTSRQKPVLQKARYLQRSPSRIYTSLKKKAFVELVSGQNLPNFSEEKK